jgi:RNA polymerase sigma-70 factor (ECF subfamily)
MQMGEPSPLPVAEATADQPPHIGPRLTAEAFASMFEDARRTLWVVAAAVVTDRAEADDLVQEAAVVALERLDSFAPGSSFAAWMSQIVRNLARNSSRKSRRRRTSSVEAATLDQNPSPQSRGSTGAGLNPLSARGDIAYEGAFDRHVLDALRSLDEPPRLCLLLKTVGELSYTDIARVLGIPEGTAMSHVHRAKRTLRQKLAESDSGPSGLGSTGSGSTGSGSVGSGPLAQGGAA